MEDTFYEYITISGEDKSFNDSLTKASIDGWEIEHINSFPINKPDYLKQSINIIIAYTAVLKRKRDRRELEKDGECESGDKK